MKDQQKKHEQYQSFLSTPLRGLLTVAIALFAVVGVVSAATTLREHYLPAEQEESSKDLGSNGTVSNQSIKPSVKSVQPPVDTTKETATSQTDNQRQQPVERAPEPEPEEKEVSVFLSHAERTISCPEKHADAVREMDAKISSYWDDILESTEEGRENWNDCINDCEENSESNEDRLCSKYAWDGSEPDNDKYEECLDEQGEKYGDCLDNCKEIYTPAVQMFSSEYDHIHSSIKLLKDSIEAYCGEYTDTNN